MASHYLRAELRSELEAVELAWDRLLRFDGGAADVDLVASLLGVFRRTSASWVLVGQQHVVKYIAQFAPDMRFGEIAVEQYDGVADVAMHDLLQRATQCPAGSHVFVCVTDRYDAHRIASALPATCKVYTFDLLKDLLGDRIPPQYWRKKFEHIYPIDIPEIVIRKHLDVLLLDMPARSLAQLPIGFAYVYKAIRQTSVDVQAIDVDL